MEQKMLRVPFDLETAKKITNGETPGRIVTRVGLQARIICWDKKSGNNMPIVALVTMKSIERVVIFIALLAIVLKKIGMITMELYLWCVLKLKNLNKNHPLNMTPLIGSNIVLCRR